MRFPSNRLGPFKFEVTRRAEMFKICTTSCPEFYFLAAIPIFLRSRTSFSLRRLPLKHFYVTLHNSRKLFRDSFRDAVCLKLTHGSCVIPSASVFSAFALNHIKKRNLHLMSVYPLDINFFSFHHHHRLFASQMTIFLCSEFFLPRSILFEISGIIKKNRELHKRGTGCSCTNSLRNEGQGTK